jgi:hypothetical protein
MIDRIVCYLALSLMVSLTSSCRSPQQPGSGWQPLFNGRDLSGWTVACKPADAAKEYWKVEEGCIVADSLHDGDHDYVWLLTREEVADFELRLKFQAFRDSPGNSGVQVRSRYDTEAGWLNGPQIDIHPPGPWRTGMVWDETRGNQRWLWPSIPEGTWVSPEMAHPNLVFYYHDDTPAWNELEITARGTDLRAVLNGVPVMDYAGAGVLDDDNHRQHNVGLRGHIALQIHSKDKLKIRFKDIDIRHLP